MKLYFKSGTKKRLVFDTVRKTWNDNFCYLGGWKNYIKISLQDYKNLLERLEADGFLYDENF